MFCYALVLEPHLKSFIMVYYVGTVRTQHLIVNLSRLMKVCLPREFQLCLIGSLSCTI